MTARQRADRLLVARGLFDSRTKAQAAIAAGLVTADEQPVRKASDAIAVDATLVAAPAFPWVSRGGVKLAHALDQVAFEIEGHVCVDVGASTGGFTEVLLARGARRVYAVDVGRDQLHARLRHDARIMSLEQTDIRALAPSVLAELPDFVTIDVSFISLKLVLPALDRLTRRPVQLVALIKPQFEVGKAGVKKGVVRDAAIHAAVCADIAALAVSLGWDVVGVIRSPIEGGDGNKEFLMGARKS